MLIRAYGTFWNPEIVDWGSVGRSNKGSLPGEVRIDGETYTIDFWEGKGIYVLHDNFQTVYVGKAFGTDLGKRIRDHLTDRLTDRWDSFSWFTLSTVNKTYANLRAPGKRHLAPETVNDTLEALAILITDPPLNRRMEGIPDAYEAEQVEDGAPRALRSYLEEILERMD
ncbi:GIY-YIG nuclease family protein [Salisaeta longa]|uniref:GIY-YIG nuclease family protein n=1 Tax=Salisaeta longa TaxID=503170 RepID=UPI0003B48844|nr:GIY-YIG nuclease family protein [Salisaeta longa]